MKQIASRSALRDRKDDLYETPREAILTLLRHEKALGGRLWEFAAGRGAISRELRAAGFDVYTTDLVAHDGADPGIISGVDFLMERQVPERVRWGVSNPPYKLADEFIRHGVHTLGLHMAVLLRLMALEGAGRSDLIDKHLVRVWAGIERLPMMHREGWEGPKLGNSGAPFAWFIFAPWDRGGAPIELRRISWRV